MPPAQLPVNETSRLAALHGLELLDTSSDPRFERLARMLAVLMDVPVALISLVDADRQWFKACVGLDARETHRDLAFCAHALGGQELLVVPDAAADPRFADNPLVTGPPGIRFYAGAPLVLPDGHVVGTLCAIDRRPREITLAERWLLSELAAAAVSMIELHGTSLALQRRAETDPLTGLATRTAFLDQVLARLAAADHGPAQALMVLDLDGFGGINALLGHQAGDAALRAVAEALAGLVPKGAALGRLGGDRFAIALCGPDAGQLADLAEACRRAADRATADGDWPVAASLGMVLFAVPPSDVEYALAQAVAALVEAKQQGGGRMVLRRIQPEAEALPMISSAA